MENKITIEARRFPVTVAPSDDLGFPVHDWIVLTKEQLRASQLVGQSSKELIHRIYERAGMTVLEIGKPQKHTITVNMAELWGR